MESVVIQLFSFVYSVSILCLRYIEGKHKQSVSKSSRYDKRLYLISGRKYVRASCVSLLRTFFQYSGAYRIYSAHWKT